MDMEGLNLEIQKTLKAAFIDGKADSLSSMGPQFLYNDKTSHRKIIDALRNELKDSVAFSFSVAFITRSGYQLLLETLKDLKARNVTGRILTTDYLAFTDPDVLLDVQRNFPNIEVKIYKTNDEETDGFHTKGYIFKQKKQGRTIYKLIIGSSNLTANALSKNEEWNAELVSTTNGAMVNEVLNQFEELWEKASSLNSYIQIYKEIYEEQKHVALSKKEIRFRDVMLKPNPMQVRFAESLERSYKIGRNGDGDRRGLLISATGTGKTYASAFGIRKIAPKRVLFLAHRTQLLTQAIRSYQAVFPADKKFALLSGDSSLLRGLDNVDAFSYEKQNSYDFVFSTSELIGKQSVLECIGPNQFDFIVVDEVHRAESPTYRRILDHFKPRYVLGMSATPERTDDPRAVYDLFDNNVIYEIRLQDALEENLLCPFHYYGVTDVEWSDDALYEKKDFSRLFNNERVDYILKETRFYGFSGSRVKGLIFVSGKDDGRILENKLKERGLKVAFLSGDDDAKKREENIRLLEKENISDGQYLDYIITVDIFNEGVDVPSINQVVFLRPTKSSIIFIQQLGRGLRKTKQKDFVVIIDFIGNYETNFMIAKAFAFDGDKETGRIRLINGGDLPGISTIEFDEIARAKILKSLSKVSFNSIREFEEVFNRLANKLYRKPSYEDFEHFSDFDPIRIIRTNGSYYSFLKRIENKLPSFLPPLPSLSESEERILVEVGKYLGAGIRLEEPLLLLSLIEGGDYSIFLDKIRKCGLTMNQEKTDCIRKIFTGVWQGEKRKTFAFTDGSFSLAPEMKEALSNPSFASELEDLLNFFIYRYETKFVTKYKDTDLCLDAQYSYRDVCELLNYAQDLTSVIGGYKYNKETKTFPVFVNYDKSPDLDESTKYEDYFVNPRILSWESKKDRRSDSKELSPLYDKETRVYLFVRKNKNDKDEQSRKYYFLGEMKLIDSLKTIQKPTGENGTIISYATGKFMLDKEVRNDIYEYLQANLEVNEK